MQAQTPLPPTGLIATGYEQHVELSWTPSTSPNVGGYQVWRSADGVQYELLKNAAATATRFIDWTGDEGQNLSRFYALKTVASNGQISDFSEKKNALTHPMTDEELLEMVQQQTFRYFWDFGHPTSGMARERNNGNGDIVTTGGTGFGIMAIVAGAQRGWVTREAAVNRMIQIASFLQVADRFHGAFPHWMDGNTGNVVAFSQYDDGGDLVETAFLIEGLLAARQYFDQNTPLEKALRGVITGLWEGVEWDWYRRNNSGVLYWHWSPKYAWQMNFPLRGFHEAQIVYILAAASPKHPVPGSLYQTGWTSSNYANTSIHYGQKVYCGPFGGGPMFFAHYSYLGFDPRGWKDAYCNYFIRNRNQALIQQAYSATVPPKHKGYSADCWGLTSCDGPDGYAAHSIYPTDDNGTIAPTAALASMPYTPEASMAALRYFYRTQGERLWGIYGFYDAFNLDKNWFAPSYLAIDQGPIVAMIENHRTGLLWKLFMQNPEIAPALQAMGFTPDNSVGTEDNFLEKQGFDCRVFPNPVSSDGLLNVEFALLRGQKISATLLDVQGRVVQVLFQEKAMPQGITTQSFALAHLPKGVLALEMANEKGEKVVRKVVVF
jgi:hypothetical protein